MTVETILGELKKLERPISEDTRASLLIDLRVYPTDIDDRRSASPEFWRRARTYFHSMQDTFYAHGVFTENRGRLNFVKACQACLSKT